MEVPNPYLAGFQCKISGGTRCNVRRYVLSLITSALLATSAFAQQAQQGVDRTKAGPLTQITIEGKPITGDDVLVRKGTAYVSVTALAQALGASMASQGQVAVMSIPAAPESDCRDAQNATRLSDAYRKAAVHIPDAVESLRALVNKQVAIIPAASFDEVDRQISEAEFRAQTDADKSVSYALSHANDTLAIMYYKLLRGVPLEYARQGQLDSVLCSMESKFALQVGRLSGKESCSVFHSNQDQAAAKPATGT
jgi:hypothetical protein